VVDRRTVECRDWEAWRIAATGTLRVTGVCTVPQAGYTCRLEVDPTTPTTATTLALRRVHTPPPDGGPWTLSECRPVYDRFQAPAFSHVLIQPDGVRVDVRQLDPTGEEIHGLSD
jgi:hypothetical protein